MIPRAPGELHALPKASSFQVCGPEDPEDPETTRTTTTVSIGKYKLEFVHSEFSLVLNPGKIPAETFFNHRDVALAISHALISYRYAGKSKKWSVGVTERGCHGTCNA